MEKFSKVIREFDYLNHMSKRKNWLNLINPLAKLIVTISYIAVLTSFPKYDLSGTLLMIIYPIFIMDSLKLSFVQILKKIWPIFLLVAFIGLFNPVFDQKPMMKIGGFVITGGMISGITLMLKGILTIISSILLIMTTGIEEICYGLRMLHIPNIFVTQILLTYRYIVVLLKEAEQIYQAYSLRAPRQRGIHIKVWGSLIGQLLFRSIDRANVLYESMLIRGYRGEFNHIKKGHLTGKDYLYLFLCLISFVFFRWLIKV